MGSGCAAIGCSNSQSQQMSLFRCPKNAERCKKWIINCRRQDLLPINVDYCSKNIRFCRDHFEDCFFMNSKKNSLTFNAEPRLFNIPNAPKVLTHRRKIEKQSPLKNMKEKENFDQKVKDTQRHINLCREHPFTRGKKKGASTSEILELKRRLKVKKDAIRYLQRKKENSLSVQQVIRSVQPSLSPGDLLVLTNQLKNSKEEKIHTQLNSKCCVYPLLTKVLQAINFSPDVYLFPQYQH